MGTLTLIGASLLVPVFQSVSDASPPALQACTASEVTVVEFALDHVGSHVLQDFTIRNVGSSTCGMDGFPGLTFFTASRLDDRVKVLQDASLYAAVPAKLLSIGPGGEASFGLAYRDDVASPNDDAAACLVQSVLIQLPLASVATGEFAFHDTFNICRSGNTVAISPVEDRSRPKIASS